MKRNLIGVGVILLLWMVVAYLLDSCRARQRQELWAEATQESH